MRKSVGHLMQDHATNAIIEFQASCYIFQPFCNKGKHKLFCSFVPHRHAITISPMNTWSVNNLNLAIDVLHFVMPQKLKLGHQNRKANLELSYGHPVPDAASRSNRKCHQMAPACTLAFLDPRE